MKQNAAERMILLFDKGVHVLNTEYPPYPVPAAVALVCRKNKLLLIKRKFEPGAGKWSLPGGKIEIGEKAAATAAREIKEECGVEINVVKMLDLVDTIFYDQAGKVIYHYLIMIYMAEYISGKLQDSPETLDVRWVPLDEANNYDTTSTTQKAIATFVRMTGCSDKRSQA